MLGAIAGDVMGSTREFRPVKTKDFALFEAASSFTDDSVMTLAVAKALLTDGDYAAAMRELGERYPEAGYGGRFRRWLTGRIAGPYGSYGNGSAMRVSPVAWAFDSEAEVLREAAASALPTHDHPEGVKGAQATALAIFMARRGAGMSDIRKEISGRFGYDLSRRLEDIRPRYSFDETCQGTVPEALLSFLESWSFEDAIRNAVSLGGDADTLAAISGSIAEAYYGKIPGAILGPALATLDEELSGIAFAFLERFRPEEAEPARDARRRGPSLMAGEGSLDPEDTVPLEALEDEAAREAWQAVRGDMAATGAWYEALGCYKGATTGGSAPSFRKAEGRKLLALGRSDFYLPFIESLSRDSGERFYQSDFMAWIEPADPYESLLYYICTAERMDFNLEGITAEDLRRSTILSGGRKRSRGELGLRFMTCWEINQVFWSDALGRTWWHLAGGMSREEALAALGGRVDPSRILE